MVRNISREEINQSLNNDHCNAKRYGGRWALLLYIEIYLLSLPTSAVNCKMRGKILRIERQRIWQPRQV